MKKLLLCCIYSLAFSCMFCIDFIKIPDSSNVSIGSNELWYYKDYYRQDSKEKVYRYPETMVTLTEYSISKYIVTTDLFTTFLDDTKINLDLLEEYPYWANYYEQNKEGTNYFQLASLYEALMFSQWLSNREGKTIRLPTNAEWEYAAMKNLKSKYPYGSPDGIFKSLLPRKNVSRNELKPGDVPEDVSPWGMEGMFGGCEYVLDNFDDKTYYNIEPGTINPLVFSKLGALSIRSGDMRYNDANEKRFGLFFTNRAFFTNSSSGTGIRLVEDLGTVFNKEHAEECVFFQNRGYVNKTIEVKKMPLEESNSSGRLIDMQEVLVLYKTLNNEWYNIFYKNSEEEWFNGWIKKEDIQLTNMHWYEDPL